MQRVIESTTSGPISFSIAGPLAEAKVVVGEFEYASVALSTEDPEGSSAYEAIQDATMSKDGVAMAVVIPGKLDEGVTVTSRRGGTYSSVSVSGNAVSYVSGGDMIVSGRDIVVNGVRVRGVNAAIPLSTGVKAEIRLPAESSLQVRCDVDVIVRGDALKNVDYSSRNGGLDLRVDCEQVDFTSYNGSLSTSQGVKEVEAETYNGDIELEQLQGDAQAITYNGNVRIAACAAGKVSVRTYNGNIRVTDPNCLGSQLLKIKTSSRNGSVRTPGS